MSTPCDISWRSRPKGLQLSTASQDGDDLAVCTTSTNLNIQIIRTYLLFTISYRTSNHQVQRPASCKLGSLNDVFASCPATNSKNLGGGGRDRTDDPLLAKQVLSQLSYAPVRYRNMVGLGGLEPPDLTRFKRAL